MGKYKTFFKFFTEKDHVNRLLFKAEETSKYANTEYVHYVENYVHSYITLHSLNMGYKIYNEAF